MACFVPFNGRNLEICLFVFRPTIVIVDELVEGLKHFCLSTETLGCLYSAVLRSIHGNMIIWYGAWMKRSNEDKELLSSTLQSMLKKVSNMSILIDKSFYEAYAGESRQGNYAAAANFLNGDIITINSATLSSEEMNENDFFYACLAIFRTHFLKMEGATAGVCLKSQIRKRVIGLFIWKSLQSCYSHILNADYKKTILPFFDGFSLDIKYDIFRVAYVSSGNNVLNLQFHLSQKMLENEIVKKDGAIVLQDLGKGL